MSTLILFCIYSSSTVHADGGAPNLVYVSGTLSGVSVIDVLQRKVTKLLAVTGDPRTILLSLDGRFLYVTQPKLGQVSVILAETGQSVCTVRLVGEPTLLALDQYSNILYAAGSGAARVTALDPTTCAVRHIFEMESPIYGLAVDVVATGYSVTHQLWVAERNSLKIFDGLTDQQLGKLPFPSGPQSLSLPPGETAYVTTRQGTVDAVDVKTRTVYHLLTGGVYGPMDYDEVTGEVYVPDEKHNLIEVLTPVFAGSPRAKEPSHIIHIDGTPQSVAITSDGQLGFIALRGGKVAQLDLPSREITYTRDVGGSPHFIITGLYPPFYYTTKPKPFTNQALMQRIFENNKMLITVYAFMSGFIIILFSLFLRYHLLRKGSRQAGYFSSWLRTREKR